VTSQAMIHSPSSVSFQHMASPPLHPTASATHLQHMASPPLLPTASATLTEQRQRRLDMVSRVHHPSVSFSRQNTIEDDDEDPYAWLSRTAPPSPRFDGIVSQKFAMLLLAPLES
jgi:hypothetical protein